MITWQVIKAVHPVIRDGFNLVGLDFVSRTSSFGAEQGLVRVDSSSYRVQNNLSWI